MISAWWLAAIPVSGYVGFVIANWRWIHQKPQQLQPSPYTGVQK